MMWFGLGSSASLYMNENATVGRVVGNTSKPVSTANAKRI